MHNADMHVSCLWHRDDRVITWTLNVGYDLCYHSAFHQSIPYSLKAIAAGGGDGSGGT